MGLFVMKPSILKSCEPFLSQFQARLFAQCVVSLLWYLMSLFWYFIALVKCNFNSNYNCVWENYINTTDISIGNLPLYPPKVTCVAFERPNFCNVLLSGDLLTYFNIFIFPLFQRVYNTKMSDDEFDPISNGDGGSLGPAVPPPKPQKKLTVEKMYQKKSQLEHILLRPDTYIGAISL